MEALVKSLHRVRGSGITRPSVVVIGDDNAKKSMLLESISKEYGLGEELADATLPVVLRFANGEDRPKYIFENGGESYEVQGKNTLIRELRKAGDSDKRDNQEVTLIIQKSGAIEHLVIVNYPDFRRYPSDAMINRLKEKYLESQDTVLLNVVNANSPDFLSAAHSLAELTNEMLDKMLLVITCSEESPNNTLEIVEESKYWNRGLGVAFIRHRGNYFWKENHLDALHQETELFRTHRYLSLVDKSIVGVPRLVEKLSIIQSSILANSLPRLCHSMDDKLNESIAVLGTWALPNSPLVTFLVDLPTIIRKTLTPFLDFDQAVASHPKVLLKLLTQSRGDFSDQFLASEIPIVTEFHEPKQAFRHALAAHIDAISSEIVGPHFKRMFEKVEAELKSGILIAFENRYGDDIVAATLRAASHAVKLQEKKHTRSVHEFLEGEKVASFKIDIQIKDSINHLLDQGLDKFRSCVQKRSQTLKLRYYDGYIDVSALHAIDTGVRENAYRLSVSLYRYLPPVYKGIVDATVLRFQTHITTLAEKDLISCILQEIASVGPSNMVEMFNEGYGETKLERGLALLAETRSVASRVVKWLPNDH